MQLDADVMRSCGLLRQLQINLFKPPFGEGGVHVTEALELRPALLWSSKDQWTLPISKVCMQKSWSVLTGVR